MTGTTDRVYRLSQDKKWPNTAANHAKALAVPRTKLFARHRGDFSANLLLTFWVTKRQLSTLKNQYYSEGKGLDSYTETQSQSKQGLKQRINIASTQILEIDSSMKTIKSLTTKKTSSHKSRIQIKAWILKHTCLKPCAGWYALQHAPIH